MIRTRTIPTPHGMATETLVLGPPSMASAVKVQAAARELMGRTKAMLADLDELEASIADEQGDTAEAVRQTIELIRDHYR